MNFLTRRCLHATRLLNAADHSLLSLPVNSLIPWPSPQNLSTPNPPPTSPHPPSTQPILTAVKAVSDVLTDPGVAPGEPLHSALERSGILPSDELLTAVFDRFVSCPKLLYGLFTWAEKNKEAMGGVVGDGVCEKVVNALGKAREFDLAWDVIRGRGELVTANAFVILIRRYARAGLTENAIRTFEHAYRLDNVRAGDSETRMLEILLDSLCKEGHVDIASRYFSHKRMAEKDWAPSIRAYNILLNGWFRSKKVRHAEMFWEEMKEGGVKPTVVTYGTLIEGYCSSKQVDRAIQLISRVKMEGIELNAVVFNPIIDALAEARRFEEAWDMMERFLVCESGPTIATYNSLVKGFCKAGDLVSANRVLKLMISRGLVPTATTYNYFFKFFAKFGKAEDGMNLYVKMLQSGYTPDRLTYHLLIKMLCEEERSDLAVQVSKEMRSMGFDMDLASSTMLIHLFCSVYKFEDAVTEFEDMIRRGVVPQYLTFQRLRDELRKQGNTELVHRLCDLMSSVPHSTKLPNTYRHEGDREPARARTSSIIKRAEKMSKVLKDCNNPRKLIKRRALSPTSMSRTDSLVEDMKKNINKT